MFQTNAVDSFVIDNFGVGNGEAKLYLRRGTSDCDYRSFFDINSSVYGTTITTLNGISRTRDNGPHNNCFFTRENIQSYIAEQLNNPVLTEFEKEKLRNFNLDNLDDKNYFGVNYIFDNQNRSYIGGLDLNFEILRYLSVSQQTIINIQKNQSNGEIEFSLAVGQL